MTADFRHLKLQIQRRLRLCLQLAEKHFHCEFSFPTVSYDVRGVKAGVALLQENKIKLNRTLLLENPHSFIQQVVPHELAHLIVFQIFGRVKAHGKEWQFVMEQLFQLPADTCHQFDITNVQGQTFSYACQCQIHQLTIRRHNQVVRKRAVYYCRKCRATLTYLEMQS